MPFDKLERFKMKIKKPPGELILILFAVFAAPVFIPDSTLKSIYAQISGAFPSRSIDVNADPASAGRDIYLLPPNILDKLAEKDNELMKVPVSISKKEIAYYENRYTIIPNKTQTECEKKGNLWDEKSNVCKVVSRKRSTDKERVLGLKLLNTKTREVEVISVQTKITINGVNIVAPDGYQIGIVERPNGIRWNWWNTLYRVISPENTVVIKNLWPREETEMVSRVVKGKVTRERKRVVRGFPYVPHSEFFEREENRTVLVEAGRKYLKDVVEKSFDTLEKRSINIDREVLLPRFFERLPLLEQGDFTEFQLDPQKTVERVLIILGANRENAWRYTCNRSDACGWVQFTPRTYRNVRVANSAAKLIVDFREGAGDHLNSMMSAMLLHKINLAPLVKKFGDKILVDPEREKYLAASYNGAPKWVSNSLSATISKAFAGWIGALSPTRKGSKGGLRKETRDFMTKLNYLIEKDLP